ncbi:hypothetical protein Q1695_011264 [Nippostrongylus brasiliensis]|nr:hypothetical protein Q1695_011264 [Nippostrongylus brasiliensis]
MMDSSRCQEERLPHRQQHHPQLERPPSPQEHISSSGSAEMFRHQRFGSSPCSSASGIKNVFCEFDQNRFLLMCRLFDFRLELSTYLRWISNTCLKRSPMKFGFGLSSAPTKATCLFMIFRNPGVFWENDVLRPR